MQQAAIDLTATEKPGVPVTYGARAFAQLLPLFEESPCIHYSDDFLKHDQRMLRATAVPGMEYLWAIRSHGTHLVALGFKNQTEIVKQILRESDPAKGQVYQLRIDASGCSTKAVTVEEALRLAPGKPLISVAANRDPFHFKPAVYSYSRNGAQVASATVCARYNRERNCTLVHVAAHIPSELDRLVRMHVAQLIEDACTAEAGSLFWTFGQHRVNDRPFDEWLADLTRICL